MKGVERMNTQELSIEEKIRISMLRKGYTYQKLSDELGISIGYISDIVKGNRSGGDYLEKIKKILEVE